MFAMLNGSIVGEQVKHMPRWFPGTSYASIARAARPALEKSRDIPFDIVQKQLVRCFTLNYS